MRIEADWLAGSASRAVCGMLTGAGYQAWYVGGCVRNALLGAPVDDLDICTDARPERVVELAKAADLKPVPTGIDHGTVTVVAEGRPFEVTTFRRDVETDGRRAVVVFAETMEEDARRRDFTMNALYAGPEGEVADPLGGLPDLEAHRLRFIGDPAERIREDYLRILRFFRFHAWYGDPEGGLDAEGLAACAELAAGIEGLSKERIGHEMRKLLAAPDPAPAMASMEITGVLMRVLPGASVRLLAVLVHVEQAAGLAPDWLRRLAALGEIEAQESLRLSKAEAKSLGSLREALGSGMGPAELGYRFGEGQGRDVLALRAAALTTEIAEQELSELRRGAESSFPVQARDLMPEYSGPELGAALKRAERLWIDSGLTLSRERLIARI